jgi:hypothetical protein
MPQELGCPVQAGPASSPPPRPAAAKVENFFTNWVEPHLGQGVPSHWVDRTSTSESFPHFSQ